MKFQCPNCDTEFDLTESGKYECPVCKNNFEFVFPEPVNVSQLEQTSYCPFCKMSIPYDAQKCGHCGEWITGKPPKSNAIYLLLSFLFGHFGVAEYYSGRVLLGLSYLIFTLLFLGISVKEPQAIIGAGVIGVIQFIIALFLGPGNSAMNPNHKPKKMNPFILWISIILAISFIAILVLNFRF